ncbi:MFS general substrate transporter [Pholiota conissans]|uniref:MFS general substrate transporter n=1 Tax=Pholiota conissans TaxID=109636 RepID=A0A9P6D885_9AGAR|nr:MFS general substrate transporter [Pholiota conissans]
MATRLTTSDRPSSYDLDEKRSILPSTSSNDISEKIPPLGIPLDNQNRSSFTAFLVGRTNSTLTPYPTFRQVVHKIDIRIMIWACIMFFALDLDRTSISQANSDNMFGDLGMTTNDFNLGNTVFRVAFLCAELPSQLFSKRVELDVWVPCQIVLWSVVSFSQFWLTGRTSFFDLRVKRKQMLVFLGFLEGGFIPDIILYLSYFYTGPELPIRLAFFWLSNYLSHIINAFLATGILRLRGVTGKEGWRYLFLIEGLLTLSIGFISLVMMPASPTQTKAWYRPAGWFTESYFVYIREEVIMVNRVLRDDPAKSDMHNRGGLNIKTIWRSMQDWRLWPIYILGLVHMSELVALPLNLINARPCLQFLSALLKHTLHSLRNLGFDTTQTNLLVIPSVVIGGIMLFIAAWFSEVANSRVAATIILQIWALPLLVALYTFDKHTSQWVYFAVITLITGFSYVHPIQVVWASRNSFSVRQRTMSASIYNMFVQAGSIVYISEEIGN